MGTKETEDFEKALVFLDEIGIKVHFRSFEDGSFLPGICIKDGEIIVDRERFLYPGDILHEAGHIAVVPTSVRLTLSEEVIIAREQREAEEMMVIAWTYAACVHLNINASFVFHEGGYKSGGDNLIENFTNGRYFGVPMLQWTGMAQERLNPDLPNLPVYPTMLKWMRD